MPKFSFIKVKTPREKSTQDKKKKPTEEKGVNRPTKNKFNFTSINGRPQCALVSPGYSRMFYNISNILNANRNPFSLRYDN